MIFLGKNQTFSKHFRVQLYWALPVERTWALSAIFRLPAYKSNPHSNESAKFSPQKHCKPRQQLAQILCIGFRFSSLGKTHAWPSIEDEYLQLHLSGRKVEAKPIQTRRLRAMQIFWWHLPHLSNFVMAGLTRVDSEKKPFWKWVAFRALSG